MRCDIDFNVEGSTSWMVLRVGRSEKPVPTIAEALWRACARLVSQSDGGEGMNGRVMENARNRIHQEVTAKWALLAIPQTLAISRKRSNTPSEGKGHTFESCRVRHKIKF
jgi:hypothetical protein